MLGNNSFAIVWREVLSDTTCKIQRLALLANCYDPKHGHYSHPKLSGATELDKSDYTMCSVHAMLWRDWLGSSIQAQFDDLLSYFDKLTTNTDRLAGEWLETEPFVHFAPATATELERTLFSSSLRVVLTLIPSQRALERFPTKPPNVLHLALSRAINVIHQLYVDPGLCTDVVCRKACISERHLRRLFNECIGKSLAVYLRDVRINAAARLLERSAHSVKVVAGMVGYNNASHFGADFRALKTCTPKQFRLKLLSGSPARMMH